MSYVGEHSSPYQSSTFGTSLSVKVDGGFNAVSINPSGRDVVLAGKQGLYIIDLDDPFQPPRFLNHVTPWQVADVQWYPHPAKPYWVVSTSNQKAIIWNLSRSSNNAIEYALHGHSRAITDINFNPQNPDILATCSIDTYVHAWDLRSPSRPFYSTSSWRSGASQVKWNFKNPNILASSHGNDVFIWDIRQGSTPLSKLMGHESSVNSIDFNRFRNNEIMTSSNDGTVKFWDISREDPCSKTISTDFPIWRGRYLPFGNGYCVMPMVGGNNSVYLMSSNDDVDDDIEQSNEKIINRRRSSSANANNNNTNKKTEILQPIQTFKGHSDTVIDFLWRSRHSDSEVDDREFQLVTWSKDSTLRLWPIDNEIYDKVGFERKKELAEKLPNYEYITYNRSMNDKIANSKLNVDNDYKRIKETFVTTSGLEDSNNMNHISWLSGVRMNRQDSSDDLFEDSKLQNLGEEVSSVGRKFSKIIFEKISVSTGELVLTLNGPWSNSDPEDYIFLRIAAKFPIKYPEKDNYPIFEIEENNNLVMEKKNEILSMLEEIGKRWTDSNQYCLEPCLRYLLGEKVNLDDIDQIDFQPLLNFDIADHIGFNSFSSDVNDSSQLLDSSSSASESDLLEPRFNEQSDFRDTFGRNLAFDSTPVPNECGAVWTPTGQLICFFTGDRKIEKITYNSLKLTQKALLKKQKSSNYDPKELFDDHEGKNGVHRPKRYVDTFSINDNTTDSMGAASGEEDSSGSSFDSFLDDWNDIIGNDIVVRTKLPALYDNFTKNFGSLPSESVKTDTSRRTKNVIIESDFSHLIPDNKDLAFEYQVMDALPEDMAKHNALVAEKYGFEDVSHCWQILSDFLMGENGNDPYSLIWNNHPRGVRYFVRNALKYFEKQNNLQMVAMLCCVLSSPVNESGEEDCMTADCKYSSIPKITESFVTFDNDRVLEPQNTRNGGSNFSNKSTFYMENNNITKNCDFNSKQRLNSIVTDNVSIKSGDRYGTNNSNKANDSVHHRMSTSNLQPYSSSKKPKGINRHSKIPVIKVELINDEVINVMQNNEGRNIIEPEEIEKYKTHVYQYAKLLYRWGMPIERAKILKLNLDLICTDYQEKRLESQTKQLHGHDQQEVIDNETDDKTGVATRWLANTTNDPTFYNCNYCQLRVVGDAFICGNCQHVIHTQCAREWWDVGGECPTGCGCNCPNLFDVQS